MTASIFEYDLGLPEPIWHRVGIHGCDFRPHFDGDLHNLFTTIYPLESECETADFIRHCAKEIAGWILASQNQFGDQDRFQIIVGWPLDVRRSGRQVVKTGGDIDAIRQIYNNPLLIEFRSAWAENIFPQHGNASPTNSR